jgi:type IV pilus assembly protein PilM
MASNLLQNFDIGKALDKLNFFKNPGKMFLPQKMLGIDIGTASIKIVEISRWGQGKTLENYGQIQSASLYKEPFRSVERGSYLLSNYFVSRAIRAVLDEAKIKTTATIFAIPDFSTFCVSFELPPMTEKEIPEAVYYAAPQYIPLPITETTLDWKLIGGIPGDKKSPLKILLVAILNETIQDYQTVAQMAGLEIYAVESEVFGLSRVFASDQKKCSCIIDIGVQSTTLNIVDAGKLRKSYSFNFAGSQLTFAIAAALGMGNAEAEDIKIKQGLLNAQENVAKTLYLLIDPLVLEVKKFLQDFYLQTGKDVDEIMLTGGTSNLPGLKEYFSEVLNKKVIIPNCFSDLLHPPILTEGLEEMSPGFSVAVGAALGGLETN